MNNLNFINRGTAQSELILSIEQAQAQPQAGWTSILGRSIHLSPHVGWVNCSL